MAGTPAVTGLLFADDDDDCDWRDETPLIEACPLYSALMADDQELYERLLFGDGPEPVSDPDDETRDEQVGEGWV